MWWKKEKRKSEVAGRLLETRDKGVCHRLVLSHARRGHVQGFGRSVSIPSRARVVFPKHNQQNLTNGVCAQVTHPRENRRNSQGVQVYT